MDGEVLGFLITSFLNKSLIDAFWASTVKITIDDRISIMQFGGQKLYRSSVNLFLFTLTGSTSSNFLRHLTNLRAKNVLKTLYLSRVRHLLDGSCPGNRLESRQKRISTNHELGISLKIHLSVSLSYSLMPSSQLII